VKPEEDKGSDAEHALKIKLPFRIFKHNFEAMVLQTMTIQVRNSKAISLLKELETKKLISIVESPQGEPKKDLASRLLGCLSEEQADAMHAELEKMRNEWERDF